MSFKVPGNVSFVLQALSCLSEGGGGSQNQGGSAGLGLPLLGRSEGLRPDGPYGVTPAGRGQGARTRPFGLCRWQRGCVTPALELPTLPEWRGASSLRSGVESLRWEPLTAQHGEGWRGVRGRVAAQALRGGVPSRPSHHLKGPLCQLVAGACSPRPQCSPFRALAGPWCSRCCLAVSVVERSTS